ncbi:MAG: signal peptidase II [Neisseriaceae bacterium]|nr:MAG: signal peptidase II [Neisseriaceae bacterium]
MKNWFYLILSATFIVSDQISKYWCNTNIQYYERISIVPNWLDLTLVYNKGVAFSMFSQASDWIHYIILTLALLICGYMVYYTFTNRFNNIQKIAGALIIGGALGNIIDRFLHGYVIDFLLFYHNSFSWPVFNLADSFISIGAFIFIFEGYAQQRRAY